jgi:hypothetical protein
MILPKEPPIKSSLLDESSIFDEIFISTETPEPCAHAGEHPSLSSHFQYHPELGGIVSLNTHLLLYTNQFKFFKFFCVSQKRLEVFMGCLEVPEFYRMKNIYWFHSNFQRFSNFQSKTKIFFQVYYSC